MFRSMDPEIRIAMIQATEERRELGHDLLGPDHLLLGLLANVRGSAYEVLAEQNVTYDWVRRVVAEKHDDRREDDGDDESSAPSDNLDEDKEALTAIGIDLDKVREAVRDAFGEDITERWGQRRGRGRGGPGRGGPGRGGPWGEGLPREVPWGGEFGGPGEAFAGVGPGGRGRRGPRSRRFERVTASMRRMLHGLRSEMRATQAAPGGDRERGLRAGVVLAAIFASDDAAVEAVIEAADNPDALRAAVDALVGHATT